MLPPCEPVAIRDEIQRILDALSEHVPPPSALTDPGADDTALAALAQALNDALDALAQCLQAPASALRGASGADLDRLGDHAVDLLARLAEAAFEAGHAEHARDLRCMILALACCVVRGDGEISHLQPVVDAAADLASREGEPARIRVLHQMTDDIVRGLEARLSGAAPDSARFQLWRGLLINRAIIATRTLEPELMVPAFDALLEELPADAPAFFRDGMRRMDAQQYPPAVREVMRLYHDVRGAGERLH
jgi:hypothetical protein